MHPQGSNQSTASSNLLSSQAQSRSTDTPHSTVAHLTGQSSLNSNSSSSLQSQSAVQPLSAAAALSTQSAVPQQTTVVNNHFLFSQQAAAVINNNSQNGATDYFANATSTMNPLLSYSTNSPSALTSSSSHYYPHQTFATYQAHTPYHPHHYPNTHSHFATNYSQLTHPHHQINHTHSDLLLKSTQF